MAVGLSATLANDMLGRFTTLGYRWIKLHIGDPGAAGTANPAVNTTRLQATWTTPAAGAMETTAALAWTSVAGTEDYTHYSVWDASTAGSFGHSGLVTADAVVAGNNFTIPAGSVDVAYTLAS